MFSSSSCVYGNPSYLPIDENHPTGVGITNPYGRTKYFTEEIIKDMCTANKVKDTLTLLSFVFEARLKRPSNYLFNMLLINVVLRNGAQYFYGTSIPLVLILQGILVKILKEYQII